MKQNYTNSNHDPKILIDKKMIRYINSSHSINHDWASSIICIAKFYEL